HGGQARPPRAEVELARVHAVALDGAFRSAYQRCCNLRMARAEGTRIPTDLDFVGGSAYPFHHHQETVSTRCLEPCFLGSRHLVETVSKWRDQAWHALS